MAFLEHTINLNDLPVSESSFDPLPDGWYSVKITGAELKNTKTSGGQYIAVKYAVLGPTHQGRIVFGNLNIKNQNTKAEEIGRQQLGEVMRAIGLNRVEDTDQLIGGDLQIKLVTKKDEQYGDKNEVKGFKAIVTTSSVLFKPEPAQAKPQGTTAAPPWAK